MAETLDFISLLRILVNARVKLVVIGGVAMTLRASAATTLDLDICFERSPENIELLCRTLSTYCPPIRAAFFDTITLLSSNVIGEKFSTTLGDIDLLGEVSGIGNYEQVLAHSTPVQVSDFVIDTLTVDGLIMAKEAANREKDQIHLTSLRALKQMLDEQGPETGE
jgi:hypothetical protein